MEGDRKQTHGAAARRRAGRATRRLGTLGIAGLLTLAVGWGAIAPSNAHASVVNVARPLSDADRDRSLDLELGKATVLRTDFRVRRVSVGDPDTVDVNVLSPREIHLLPGKLGSTNVVLWDESGTPVVVIDAQVGSSFTAIERRIESVLGVQGIRVESAGAGVVLTGIAPTPIHAERALAVARAFFPKAGEDRVVNAIQIGGNQQVMLEVIVAEMRRSFGRDLTVNWSTVIETGGRIFAFESLIGDLLSINERTSSLTPPGIERLFDIGDRFNLGGTIIDEGSFLLDVFIDATQSRGLAKVLAKPTLIARSGQTASFLVGGEVPIPIAQGGAFGSITIEFKKFGVGVEFAPTVLGEDRIHLEVSPEVSQPDFTIGTVSQGTITPGFVTRRASTSVELGDGQSFAIAGLLEDNVTELLEKFPLLGDIPILGALFRSKSFQRDETELVIIVTPRIVKPLPPGPVRLPTDSFVEPNDFEFYLLGALESQRRSTVSSVGGDHGGWIGPVGHRLAADVGEMDR